MFNTSVKEMNKQKKVENWLKSSSDIVSVPPLTKTKETYRKRSTSLESASNSIPTKTKKVKTSATTKLQSKKGSTSKKNTIVIESTDNSDNENESSSKENLLNKNVELSEGIFDDYRIPYNRYKKQIVRKTTSSGSKHDEKNLDIHTKKDIKTEKECDVFIKREDTLMDDYLEDETTQNSNFMQHFETKKEEISPKKERISPKKVMRPASFILKPTSLASTQTDIDSTNLKDLMKCEDGLPAQLKSETVFKFTIDMCNDQFVHHTERDLFDKKKNNLNSWYQYILDNYKSKHEYKGKEGCNGFITLDSRFRVMACDDEKQVLTVVEVLTDGSDVDNWMRNIREPIRIHTVLEREQYELVLGENANRLPDLIITRLFPNI